jgi:hypothetical protein
VLLPTFNLTVALKPWNVSPAELMI